MIIEQQEQKLINVLSMSARARKIVSGSMLVEQSIKSGQVKYLLIAKDAEDSTKKNFQELAEKLGISYNIVLDGTQLGKSIGKTYRAVVGLIDSGFADRIKHIDQIK